MMLKTRTLFYVGALESSPRQHPHGSTPMCGDVVAGRLNYAVLVDVRNHVRRECEANNKAQVDAVNMGGLQEGTKGTRSEI